MVTQYGLSPLGPLNYAAEDGYQKPFSEETGAMIDAEIKKIIDSALSRCRTLLSEKKELVQK